jgi:hypothetical protein
LDESGVTAGRQSGESDSRSTGLGRSIWVQKCQAVIAGFPFTPGASNALSWDWTKTSGAISISIPSPLEPGGLFYWPAAANRYE